MKNGFEEALDNLKTVANVNQKVTMEALEEAANYFADQLKKEFPKSELQKDHAVDQIEVVVEKDVVKVIFGADETGYYRGWYWFLVENGHRIGKRKQKALGHAKGSHVVRKTVTKESKKLQEMILAKL